MPWLSILIAIPAVGALAVALLRSERVARQLAFGVSLLVLVLTLVMAAGFDPGGIVPGSGTVGGRWQFAETYDWIPRFGIHYAVGLDGIALVLIVLSAILVPVVVLASWNIGDRREAVGRDAPGEVRVQNYFAWMLVLEAMMIGVFAATDIVLFYVFFEAMLVPMYFMIGSYGGPQRSYAAVKFLLYSLFGGLIMLVAVIALPWVAAQETPSFLLGDLATALPTADPMVLRWLFLGFFLAFAIKAPLVPFHTWLPDAAGQAPAGAAVLLVGVLDKVGTFGMLRFCLELFPEASRWFTPVIVALSVAGIIYGAIVAIGQADMKRLIAYTSISHFGFITLGVFALTETGQSGATLYMVNHGFATGALFLIAGFLVWRRGSALIDDYGGVQKVAPVLAGTFLIAGLSGLALPGLNSFVSEFMVLIGSYERFLIPTIIGTLGVILAAFYILWMYQRTMNGPTAESVKDLPDLGLREKVVIAPLIAIIVALGLFPQPLLNVINPAVGCPQEKDGKTVMICQETPGKGSVVQAEKEAGE